MIFRLGRTPRSTFYGTVPEQSVQRADVLLVDQRRMYPFSPLLELLPAGQVLVRATPWSMKRGPHGVLYECFFASA